MISNIRAIFVINILVMCLPYRDFRHLDIRQQFLYRKKLNKISQARESVIDSKNAFNEEFLDGVVHYKVSSKSKHTKLKRIHEIEKDFRRLLAMKGVTYNYKRDVAWRTWRYVLYPTGNKNIICYKCNGETINRKNCNGGVWTIEEKPPPCPYEFYSLVDDDVLCGANYTQYKDVKSSCPSLIKFTDLTSTCDNPIETTWRFTRVFNNSNKYENVICGGRDYCEIFTIYEISPEHVVFRIINSSNVVTYSRIMKPGNMNYICVEDCGTYDPIAKKVIKNENPLKLNMLSPSIKTKRENKNNVVLKPMTMEKEMSNIDRKLPAKVRRNGINKFRTYSENNDLMLHEFQRAHITTNCKEVGKLPNYEDFYDDY